MDEALILERNWEFRVEHKGIKIYSARVSGSDILSFKGEVELQVSLKRLLSLFHDIANYQRWVHQLALVEVLDKTDGTEYVIRQVINTPWPLQQREVIMRSRLMAAGDNAIALSMKEENDYLPVNPRYHRVNHATGMWIFTPNGHGVVHVVFVMHLDPGQDVPAPVSNAGLFEVPFYSLNNLRTLLQDTSYNPPWPKELEEHLAIIEDIPDQP